MRFILSRRSPKQLAIRVFLLAVLTTTAIELRSVYFDRRLRQAELFWSEGYASLAERLLVPRKSYYATTNRGCTTMLNALLVTGNAKDLQWVMEACSRHGIQIRQVLDAQVRLLTAHGDKAQLAAVNARLGEEFQDKDATLAAARGFAELGNSVDAVRVLTGALARSPDNIELQLEAMRIFIQLKELTTAKALLAKLRANPMVTSNRQLTDAVTAATSGVLF